MRTFRFSLSLAVLLIGAGGSGCKSQSRIEDIQRPMTLRSTFPAEGLVTSRELMPMQLGLQRYVESLGEWPQIQGGHDLTFTFQPSSEFAAQWSRAEGDSRREFFSIDSQGNILLHAVIEYGDKAISQFSPPLIVAFAEMPAGVELRSESKMRVVDLNNRLKQREIGSAVRTIKYVDDQSIWTALTGEHRAKRLEVHFTADLKLADADEHTTLWVVPGIGIIAEENREEIKVLGLAGKSKHRVLTYIDSTPAETPATVTSMPQ